MSASLGIGLIGLGKHGERYAAHIADDLPGLHVAAVCRQNTRQGERRAAEMGARFCGDLWALAADRGVEAIVAAVPPFLHAEIVRAATAEGKPLLLEKPFALDAKEAAALVRRIDDARVPVMVAHTLRFNPVVDLLREWAAEIGAPHQVILGQSFEPSPLAWLDDPKRSGGGNILHTGIHEFDLARFLTGAEADEVSCLAGRVTTERTEDSFAAQLFLTQDNGGMVLASVTASRGTQSRYGEIRLVGANGQIAADHVHGTIQQIRGRRILREERLADQPTVQATLEAFERMVREGVESPITARDGARAVAIADACYRSLRSRRREAVAKI